MPLCARIAELSARGLAPATVTTAGQLMSKIMASAVRSGCIAGSPCAGVKFPTIEREEMRFLSPADVGVPAESIDQRFHALVFLGAYGGLRMGEMFGLRAARVDLLRSRVTLPRPVSSLRDISTSALPRRGPGAVRSHSPESPRQPSTTICAGPAQVPRISFSVHPREVLSGSPAGGGASGRRP